MNKRLNSKPGGVGLIGRILSGEFGVVLPFALLAFAVLFLIVMFITFIGVSELTISQGASRTAEALTLAEEGVARAMQELYSDSILTDPRERDDPNAMYWPHGDEEGESYYYDGEARYFQWVSEDETERYRVRITHDSDNVPGEAVDCDATSKRILSCGTVGTGLGDEAAEDPAAERSLDVHVTYQQSDPDSLDAFNFFIYQGDENIGTPPPPPLDPVTDARPQGGYPLTIQNVYGSFQFDGTGDHDPGYWWDGGEDVDSDDPPYTDQGWGIYSKGPIEIMSGGIHFLEGSNIYGKVASEDFVFVGILAEMDIFNIKPVSVKDGGIFAGLTVDEEEPDIPNDYAFEEAFGLVDNGVAAILALNLGFEPATDLQIDHIVARGDVSINSVLTGGFMCPVMNLCYWNDEDNQWQGGIQSGGDVSILGILGSGLLGTMTVGPITAGGEVEIGSLLNTVQIMGDINAGSAANTWVKGSHTGADDSTTEVIDETKGDGESPDFEELGVTPGLEVHNTVNDCRGTVTSVEASDPVGAPDKKDKLVCSGGFTGGWVWVPVEDPDDEDYPGYAETENDFDTGDGYEVESTTHSEWIGVDMIQGAGAIDHRSQSGEVDSEGDIYSRGKVRIMSAGASLFKTGNIEAGCDLAVTDEEADDDDYRGGTGVEVLGGILPPNITQVGAITTHSFVDLYSILGVVNVTGKISAGARDVVETANGYESSGLGVRLTTLLSAAGDATEGSDIESRGMVQVNSVGSAIDLGDITAGTDGTGMDGGEEVAVPFPENPDYDPDTFYGGTGVQLNSLGNIINTGDITCHSRVFLNGALTALGTGNIHAGTEDYVESGDDPTGVGVLASSWAVSGLQVNGNIRSTGQVVLNSFGGDLLDVQGRVYAGVDYEVGDAKRGHGVILTSDPAEPENPSWLAGIELGGITTPGRVDLAVLLGAINIKEGEGDSDGKVIVGTDNPAGWAAEEDEYGCYINGALSAVNVDGAIVSRGPVKIKSGLASVTTSGVYAGGVNPDPDNPGEPDPDNPGVGGTGIEIIAGERDEEDEETPPGNYTDDDMLMTPGRVRVNSFAGTAQTGDIWAGSEQDDPAGDGGLGVWLEGQGFMFLIIPFPPHIRTGEVRTPGMVYLDFFDMRCAGGDILCDKVWAGSCGENPPGGDVMGDADPFADNTGIGHRLTNNLLGSVTVDEAWYVGSMDYQFSTLAVLTLGNTWTDTSLTFVEDEVTLTDLGLILNGYIYTPNDLTVKGAGVRMYLDSGIHCGGDVEIFPADWLDTSKYTVGDDLYNSGETRPLRSGAIDTEASVTIEPVNEDWYDGNKVYVTGSINANDITITPNTELVEIIAHPGIGYQTGVFAQNDLNINMGGGTLTLNDTNGDVEMKAERNLSFYYGGGSLDLAETTLEAMYDVNLDFRNNATLTQDIMCNDDCTVDFTSANLNRMNLNGNVGAPGDLTLKADKGGLLDGNRELLQVNGETYSGGVLSLVVPGTGLGQFGGVRPVNGSGQATWTHHSTQPDWYSQVTEEEPYDYPNGTGDVFVPGVDDYEDLQPGAFTSPPKPPCPDPMAGTGEEWEMGLEEEVPDYPAPWTENNPEVPGIPLGGDTPQAPDAPDFSGMLDYGGQVEIDFPRPNWDYWKREARDQGHYWEDPTPSPDGDGFAIDAQMSTEDEVRTEVWYIEGDAELNRGIFEYTGPDPSGIEVKAVIVARGNIMIKDDIPFRVGEGLELHLIAEDSVLIQPSDWNRMEFGGEAIYNFYAGHTIITPIALWKGATEGIVRGCMVAGSRVKITDWFDSLGGLGGIYRFKYKRPTIDTMGWVMDCETTGWREISLDELSWDDPGQE